MHEPRFFGNDLITSDGVDNGARSTQRQRPRRFLGRIISALLWVTSGCVVFAVYTNVLADDSAVRMLAESTAREHAACGSRCQITRMVGRRSVIDLIADYDFEGSGTVRVVCRRSAIVVGDHECNVR